mgnify:CR=1 FL=1
MKKTFTIKQIDRISAELQKLQNSKKHWPVKVNYAIAKNLKALLAELETYNAERTRVLKENALKDENGNAVVEDGSYKFAEDKEQEVIKEIGDMYNIETEHDVQLEDVNECDSEGYDGTTLEDITAIEFMIQE